MQSQSLEDFAATASLAQRAYMAQQALTHKMLCKGTLPGWSSLGELREFHRGFTRTAYPGVWALERRPSPVICGPRGAEVSRYSSLHNELRMAPQDLNVLAYSHELAHALTPTHGHDDVWAEQHLGVMRELVAYTHQAAFRDAAWVEHACSRLTLSYLALKVVRGS